LDYHSFFGILIINLSVILILYILYIHFIFIYSKIILFTKNIMNKQKDLLNNLVITCFHRIEDCKIHCRVTIIENMNQVDVNKILLVLKHV